MGQAATGKLALTFGIAGALLQCTAVAAGTASPSKGKRPNRKKKKQNPVNTVVYLSKVQRSDEYAHDEGFIRFTEELTLHTFNEKVRKVANGTDSQSLPPYYPLVLFHVDWCTHCKQALPEFEKAAEMVARMTQVSHHLVLPRFFILECGREELKDMCTRHTGLVYPALIAFRDKRAIVFRRPRVASTIAWWSMRVSLPAVLEIATEKHLESYGQEITFLLKVDPKKDRSLISDWSQVALSYLDEYTLATVHVDTELGKSLPLGPSVSVRARPSFGLVPLPFQGLMCRRTLEAWVRFNQFPPVVELTKWTQTDIQNSGLIVVTLVHSGGSSGSKVRQRFNKKVAQMRPRGKYLFASVNISDREAVDVLQQRFPMLVPEATRLPRVFAFCGRDLYWEDAELLQLDQLSIDNVEALLFSSEARHDDSTSSWRKLKMKRKILLRYATRSWTTVFVAVTMPFFMMVFLWTCLQALFMPEDTSVEISKADHVD